MLSRIRSRPLSEETAATSCRHPQIPHRHRHHSRYRRFFLLIAALIALIAWAPGPRHAAAAAADVDPDLHVAGIGPLTGGHTTSQAREADSAPTSGHATTRDAASRTVFPTVLPTALPMSPSPSPSPSEPPPRRDFDDAPNRQQRRLGVDPPPRPLPLASPARSGDAEHARSPWLTAAEADARAVAADRLIRFVSLEAFDRATVRGAWFVFFGTRWCRGSRRLTPRWLRLQQQWARSSLPGVADGGFQLAKVDCTPDEAFCERRRVDGFPTLFLYVNGQLTEEYTGEQQLPELWAYLQEKAHHYDVHRQAMAEIAQVHDEF